MENKYYIPDMETGYRHEVTREQWEAYKRALESFNASLSVKYSGPILIVGTAGELDGKEDYKELFYEK